MENTATTQFTWNDVRSENNDLQNISETSSDAGGAWFQDSSRPWPWGEMVARSDGANSSYINSSPSYRASQKITFKAKTFYSVLIYHYHHRALRGNESGVFSGYQLYVGMASSSFVNQEATSSQKNTPDEIYDSLVLGGTEVISGVDTTGVDGTKQYGSCLLYTSDAADE